MNRPSRGPWSPVIPALLFVALVAAVYASPLFFRSNFTGRDLLAYNLPLEKSIHDAYARGRLPVWTPEVSGGRPLMPNPNAGALYPVRALFSRIGFPLAMRLYPLLHWAAAGIGMLLLLSTLSTSRGAAWVGAVTYAFSGVVVSEVFYPHILPGMTLLPWLLWTAARPVRRPAGQTLLFAFLFTLDLLAADVFTVGLGVLCVALWVALESDRAERRALCARLVVALGLAALAALPQILATALWIPETNRAVVGMRLSEVTRFSVSPWRLAELVVPYPFGETWRLIPTEVWGWRAFGDKAMGLFSTLYAGALAAMAVGTMWKSREPGMRFARALLVLALAASVLPSLLPSSLGQRISPIALRNPEKFAVAAVLALAILATRALDVYRARRRRPRGGLLVAALLALAAGLTALWPAETAKEAARWLAGGAPVWQFAGVQLSLALAEAGLLWVMTVAALELAPRPSICARAAALALLTLVPVAATRRIPEVSSEEETFGPTLLARRIARSDPQGAYRTLGESIYETPAESAARSGVAWTDLPRDSWMYYTSIFWGRGTVFNYDFDAGDLARVESLRRLSGLAAGSSGTGPFFGNLCLRFGVRPRGRPPTPGFHRVGGNAAQDWDELEGAQPDIRLATRWREEPGALAVAAELPRLSGGDLLLETGRRADGEASPGVLRILEKSPERLRLQTETREPSWLFVLRAFWNHRTVSIDGREVETVPAYLAYTAVPVPAGRHAIDWRERVPGGESSRFGPLAAGIAATLLFVSDSRRRHA